MIAEVYLVSVALYTIAAVVAAGYLTKTVVEWSLNVEAVAVEKVHVAAADSAC